MAETQHGGHHGGTSVEEHQRTFDGFIRFWVYVFGAAALVLVFLAIFNT